MVWQFEQTPVTLAESGCVEAINRTVMRTIEKTLTVIILDNFFDSTLNIFFPINADWVIKP